MQLSIQILATIMFSAINAQVSSIIPFLYNDLVLADGDINKLDAFMNQFADGMKYCDITQNSCSDKEAFEEIIEAKYFDPNRLNYNYCVIGQELNVGLSAYFDCMFVVDNDADTCRTYLQTTEYADLDAYGAKILQHYLYNTSILGYDDKVEGGCDNNIARNINIACMKKVVFGASKIEIDSDYFANLWKLKANACIVVIDDQLIIASGMYVANLQIIQNGVTYKRRIKYRVIIGDNHSINIIEQLD